MQELVVVLDSKERLLVDVVVVVVEVIGVVVVVAVVRVLQDV